MDDDAIQVPGTNGPGMTPEGCPAVIDCPGTDSPVANFSSEAPDTLIFTGVGWVPFNPYSPPPLIKHRGELFYAHDCFGNQLSVVSQEDADFLSYAISQLCQDPGQPPDPLNPETTFKSYQDQDQTACGVCSDGTEFCYTVFAHTFVGPKSGGNESAVIASANAQALSYAQKQVSIIASRGICAQLGCKIASTSPLPDASQGTHYSFQFVAFTIFPNQTWKIKAGLIPPGLSLSLAGTLSGTPSSTGTYNFTVQLTCGGIMSTSRAFKLTAKTQIANNRYWTMDESGTNDRVDKFFGDVIHTVAPQTVGSAVGKIANAMSVAGTPAGYGYAFTNTIPFATTQGGFSIAFWFKALNNGTMSPPSPTALIRLNLATSNGSNGYSAALYNVNTLGFWTIGYSDYSGGGSANECGQVPATIGQWVFIHIFFDGMTKKVGYSLNGGGEIVGSDTVASVNCDNYLFEIASAYGSNAPQFLVDEVLVSLKHKLTTGEIASIYNGGSGVTWPQVKALIPP